MAAYDAPLKTLNNATLDVTAEYEEDDEGIVEPVVLLATWRAHQNYLVPFDPDCSDYAALMRDHRMAAEVILRVLVPQLIEDLGDAIWELHHRACLRLRDYFELDPTAEALRVIAADLVYAVATAPYITQPSGNRTFCLDTLELKRLWYRRTQMGDPGR